MNPPGLDSIKLDRLARLAMKVWLVSEALKLVESEKNEPDQEILEACKCCASVSMWTANLITSRQVVDLSAPVLLTSMIIRSFYKKYLHHTEENVQYWVSICCDCCCTFKLWFLYLSRN